MPTYLAIALLGVLVGRGLNLVITAWPWEAPPLALAGRCPLCRVRLGRLPLWGHIWLKGRCPACQGAWGLRPLAVELISGVLALALWLKFPGSLLLLVYGPFAALLLTLAVIDWEHYQLPDVLTLGGAALGLALAAVMPHLQIWQAGLGALAGAGAFWLLQIAYRAIVKQEGREGLGGGDIKLMAGIGAFVGYKPLLGIVFMAALLASLAALWGLISGRLAGSGGWRRQPLAFGTFLAAAAMLHVLRS